MSWIQRLYDTYEACAGNPDYTDPPQPADGRGVPALSPVGHILQTAHVRVVIDGRGNFQRAELLPPKKQCLMPASEKSATRSGAGALPYALADKVHYCARDYEGTKKNFFAAYVEQLGKWCESSEGSGMELVKSVHAYVSKGTVVRDLIQAGIMHADRDGRLLLEMPESADGKESIFSRLQPKKVNGANIRDQGDALIVWTVEGTGAMQPNTWENSEVHNAWINYDATLAKEKTLCLVQGNVMPVAEKHPRNIRRPGDGAKLISSNDEQNFTFKGRFCTAGEAASIGYETSLKAHAALSWIIARQGYRNGEQAVVAWAQSGKPIPQPCVDLFDLDSEEQPQESSISEQANMGAAFARQLGKALKGYRASLQQHDGIAIMALEAASPGRLSITFYREQMAEEYFARLEQWQKDCAWRIPVAWHKEEGQKKSRIVYMVCAPNPSTIARMAYGKRIDDKLHKATVERLLPCIVDGAKIPRDLVENSIRQVFHVKHAWGLANTPETYDWHETLGVACAIFKGYHARCKTKEEYSMALDESRCSRDYLYGRLLATAEYIERTALEAAGESRPTNAERLMQRFADRPYETWRQLESQLLRPYIQRLQSSGKRGLLVRAQKVLEEIHKQFDHDDYVSPKKLSGEFLLGYHNQYSAFFTKKDAQSGEDASNDNDYFL